MTRRLAIGPANYAGQGFAWAEAVREHLAVPSISFATNRHIPWRRNMASYQFDVHHRFPHHRLSTVWGKAFRLGRLLRDVTHMAADGFLPLYGRHDTGDLACDLRRVEGRGIRIAMIAHGSDIRDPDAHMARHPFSFYATAPTEWVDRLRRRSRRNRTLAETVGVPLFVSTPDLLLDVPHATWLPLCIDPIRWVTDRPAFSDGVPTVLFVPSQRHPPIKGTEVVDPVLRGLAAAGKINYLSPSFVTHDEMPALVRRADVVVDQVMTGSYGVAAVEGMAAGRLVVGFVGTETRALMPENPPIVDAAPSCFTAVIDHILGDPETYAERAAAGPAFVERWHSGRASAAAVEAFLCTH
jgi:hypothetical protein